ncbi:probable glucomannan 4-beta-mannosyltransferase 11 [Dioscorea cayenensis subsp. rotundata]|uniref:glucomannan 4-beta-mannosyltransferase n=1 Tax=Dioscorea cayennensis subsp. rotundata TaxID=55577 RepID=A0AB40AI35_DIOCR|nr:probable glucomannan 4-beta-mannosyltransferase 11 [Dioscorea cayenensis subsp. rotundata]
MKMRALESMVLLLILIFSIVLGSKGMEFNLSMDVFVDGPAIWFSDGVNAGNFVGLLNVSSYEGFGMDGAWEKIVEVWVLVRGMVVAPVMRVAMVLCMVMSLMLLVEFVFMSLVSLGVKILRRKPEIRYKWEALKEDPEIGTSVYPMVLVQIPMFNEKEVYKLSIGAACGLAWPPDRFIIQVLDDSTDPIVKAMVELECNAWASKGMNIHYEVRNNRKGYKAGALKEGMEHSYVHQCDFVAIFDSDFQPEPDFLMRTVPFLVNNPKIALVQARWEFVNFGECLMTRIQRMSLDYHFKVEQEAGSCTFAFFGFNGTAGVWRISALNEAGGWEDRTTVEDMDLAVRAILKGWKFLYVGDVKVKSELPSNFKAYRHQQHRWTCGAANLFRKVAFDIMRAKDVSLWKKLYVLYSFFIVRKVVAHVVTFFLYCVVVPASALIPEVNIPIWMVVHIPTTITLLNAIRNTSFIHLMPLWILFENVMSMHRMKATMIGLLEAKSANEWVVTEKLGGAIRAKPENQILEKPPSRFKERLNYSELRFGFFLLLCASYDVIYGVNYYFIYIYLQALAFFIMGVGFVGRHTSNS